MGSSDPRTRLPYKYIPLAHERGFACGTLLVPGLFGVSRPIGGVLAARVFLFEPGSADANRTPAAAGHTIDSEERFRRRANLVENSPGFIRNEVHRPRPIMKFDRDAGRYVDDPEGQGHYEVKTWLRTMEDFVAWIQSPSFAKAHKDRPPAEMSAGPNVLEVHELLSRTDLDLAGK